MRMISVTENINIDPMNIIEREINGCKVRLYFSVEHNDRIERQVLDNLLMIFDEKRHCLSTV